MRESSIYNKKGFTLLELLIAVSIFGIILVMTFSIINYVPKLAKTESSQYSERTDVRRALTEITGTIQNASIVAFPSIEFTMPGGEKISYEYNKGNVNKRVNDMPQRLMESVDEFTITSADYHLFNIHIKTSKEGKAYDFKVERRRGGKTKSDAVISSITPTNVVFDKNPLIWGDKDITMNLNGNSLNCLWNDLDKLTPEIDYSINDNILTLKKEYLATQNGTIYIVFDVTNGVDPKLTVEIRDTSTNIKVAGNSLEDDLVRMNYPGNLQIDPGDNTWILTVTNGTLDGDVDKDDLTITGLPAGINVTAAKVTDENKIVITLSGTASAPVTTTKAVEIIINDSGVTEKSALASDTIKVFLLPGASFASPEHNLMFTNELYFKNNVTITGDIVIGRGESMTYIDSNCQIYGYVYVDSSLQVKNNITIGSSIKNAKVFIKGSADFDNGTIYGDLFYRDTLSMKNHLNITGKSEQSAVEIPPISIPALKLEQWYIDNGYTIIDSSDTNVTIVDNGKYFFKTSYVFRNNDTNLYNRTNITIVGKSDLYFDSNFKGSGIIFAPNGKITFKNNCELTGMCISKSTDVQGNGTLTFRRYTELPFD